MLQWAHFVPAADQLFDQQAKEFGKQAGVEIVAERINQNDIQARVTAAIQSGSGADIVTTANNHPLLYENSLVDVTDVADANDMFAKSIQGMRAADAVAWAAGELRKIYAG